MSFIKLTICCLYCRIADEEDSDQHWIVKKCGLKGRTEYASDHRIQKITDLTGNPYSSNAAIKNLIPVSSPRSKKMKIFEQALQTLLRHSTLLPCT
jgi:hypothetical protein